MKTKNSPHDELTMEFAKKIRHTISESLSFVECCVRNLSGKEPDLTQALKLYDAGTERLRTLLVALDQYSKSGPVETAKNFPRYDLVLIDDDPLIKMLWEYEAKNRKLIVLVLPDSSEVTKLNISKRTPIYVDKNLLSGISGLEILSELNSSGFELLYLASGELTTMENLPSWLSGSIGKSFPDSICG